MAHDDTIHRLNELIHINKDGESGFQTAAENIKNTELESMFEGWAKQHAKFAGELQQEVKRLGGDYTDSGTVGGALHRGWLDVKSALSGHSAAAILKSCEAGEDSAVAAYARAAADYPSGQTNALIEKHHQQIKEFHKRLCRLISETKDGVDFQKNE